MSESIVWSVTTTTPTRNDALTIARALVEQKLAAGAEITGPATSVFWHLGEFGEGEEYRLTVKTSRELRDTVMAKMLVLHPWENPEVLATAVDVAPPAYIEWLLMVTGSPAPEV